MPSFAKGREAGSLNSPEIELALQQAQGMAQHDGWKTVRLEHVLAAVLDAKSVQSVFESQRVDANALNKALSEYLHDLRGAGSVADADPALQRTMERLFVSSFASGKRTVLGADLLVAIALEGSSFAARALRECGFTAEDTVPLSTCLRWAANQVRDPDEPPRVSTHASALGTNQFMTAPLRTDAGAVGGPREYTVRVTNCVDKEAIQFKIAVSHQGGLEFRTVTTPFAQTFLTNRIIVLLEAIDVDRLLKAELVSVIEGVPRTICGFDGLSGTLFDDAYNPTRRYAASY